MKKQSPILFFAGLVFIIPVTAYAILNWYEKKMETLPVLGKTKEHRVSPFSLTGQDGAEKTTGSWKNKIVVADFFFTHCPTICPQMTKSMKRVQDAYKDQKDLWLVSFTVDPERDSAPVLRSYANRYAIDNSNWELLTGDKKEIYKMARNSFMIVATDGDGGPDDFIHSEKLVLVDPQKRVRGYYDGTSRKEVNQLIADIKKLKYEN
jgi:protein SCO1/2